MIRYLATVAGLALAVLFTVPAAATASEDTGPNSHACSDAKRQVDHLKGKLADLLRHEPRNEPAKQPGPPRHQSNQSSTADAAAAPANLALPQLPLPQLLQGADSKKSPQWQDWARKVAALKHDLEKALWAKDRACRSHHDGKPDHRSCASEHHDCDNNHDSDDKDGHDKDSHNKDSGGEFTQVKDVPTGPVDTGGGPA